MYLSSGCSHSKFKVEKQFNRYELEMGLVIFSTRRFMHVWEACLPSYKGIKDLARYGMIFPLH
ncbi:hypothetical protein HanPI659440_Chr14g0529481 [Helianthus annuus]|nr:hypothetical protein HanPI659440_Chr14g0529481 [Helianthus annuus]